MASPETGTKGMKVDWQPLGPSDLNSRIRAEIMRVVSERTLAPGDRLPSERDLAAALQVSRPSVREAVRSLQAEGRLVVRHGQGVYVAEPAAVLRMRKQMQELDHDLSELFAMREILEVPAARWATQRHDEAALSAVQKAHDQLDQALQQQEVDFDELQRLDSAFHLCIVQASGNRLLEQTQSVLHELMRTGMQTTFAVPGRIAQSKTEHARILTALLSGDATGAARAARDHVRGARDAAERRIAAATSESGLV